MNANPDLSCFYKKSLSYFHAGISLEFQTSQSLFSSHQVDIGTQHLIKSLNTTEKRESILDLGCGYGPLGLWAGKALQTQTIHMVDRDALAVAFAVQNTFLNDLTCTSYGSLGYDQVPDMGFDLILSNIPGKAGKTVIRAMLQDARSWLNPGGSVAIVIVTPLEPLVQETLSEPDVQITYHEQFGDHSVLHYQFAKGDAPRSTENSVARRLYDRGMLNLDIEAHELSLRTARGLAEFESLSFDTQLVLKVLQKFDQADIQSIHCVNVGQGILPVYLSQIYNKSIALFDRDLLALAFTKQNLLDNGCSAEQITTHHQPLYRADVDQPSDLTVFVLRDDEGPDVHQQHISNAIQALSTKGSLIIAGGSTPITRLTKWLEGQKLARISQRKRNKGRSIITVQQR